MSIKGGFVETYGFHKTRIKIFASDWVADNDSTSYSILVYDTADNGSVMVGNSGIEAYAFKEIPHGYKATHCRINCSDSIEVKVYKCDISGSAGVEIQDNASTQYTNTEFTLTETSADDNNYLMIFVYTTATTNYIRGGYVTIERI